MDKLYALLDRKARRIIDLKGQIAAVFSTDATEEVKLNVLISIIKEDQAMLEDALNDIQNYQLSKIKVVA